MKKQFLSIIITIALICTILPLPVAAADGATIEPAAATAQGLQDAIDAANDGDTIKLKANIDIEAAVTNVRVSKSITLDLNSYAISSSISGTGETDLNSLLYYTATGTLTITDSSASENGRITSDANYCVLINNVGSGTVAFEKGTLSSTGDLGVDIINASDGHISISGGTISSNLSYAVYSGASSGTVDITGGTISSNTGFAVISRGIANMSGGTVSSDAYFGLINYETGTLTLTGGTISSNNNFAVHNFGHLVMLGGTISSAASDGLSNSGDASIADISGGTIHTNTGIALVNYAAGVVNVSGGVISSGGDCAVYNYGSGSINITGGEIFANRVTFYNNSTGTITINEGTVSSVSNKTGVVKINGGSVKIVGTASPVNDAGTSLVLYTFVLKDTAGNVLADTNLSSATLQFTPSTTPAYNMSGVKTDANGKIYVWLPSDKTAVSLSFNGLSVSGDIVDYLKEIVIPNFSATVTLNKDDALWEDTSTLVLLCESNSNIYTGNGAIYGTLNNGKYTFRGLDSSKTYYVWVKTFGIACADKIITKDAADKTLDLYSITLTAGEGIASTVGNGSIFLKGSNVEIAAAATDYTFSEWLAPDNSTVGISARYNIINLSAPCILTATATLNLYAATVTVNKDNSVWTIGTPVMKLSESSTDQVNLLTVTPSDGVYTFTDLNPATTYYVWDTTNSKFTGQTINKNTTSAALDYYTVTLTTGTGVSDATGTGIYMKGSDVAISASVLTNFAWNNWVQTSDSTTISTAQDFTITSNSAPYALTATATSTIYDATVTVKTDDATWASGTPSMQLSESSSDAASNTVTGTNSSGVYTFTGLAYNKTYYVWDTTNDQYTGETISRNRTSAVVDYYTVTLATGTGIDSATGTYRKGSSVPINATPSSAHLWSKWLQTKGGATLSTEQAYTIKGIDKPYSLTAMGTLDTYTATVTVNIDGSVWKIGTPVMAFSKSSSSQLNPITVTPSAGVYTVTGLVRTTTYYVWDTTNNKFTGQIINKNTTSAVLDYYTVDSTTGAGISSVTGTGAYMKGSDVSLDAVVSDGYSWNRWVQSAGGSTESTTKTYTIMGIDRSYSLTATSMPDLGGSEISINADAIIIEDDPVNAGKIQIRQGAATRGGIDPTTNIAIKGSGVTPNTITVSASLGTVITLKEVNIVSTTAPFLITSAVGAVTVDLDGANTLEATASGYAGLQKANDGSGAGGMLTIQSTTGTGSLTATGYGNASSNGAGIGGYSFDGGPWVDGSYITITGGTIIANGGYRGAGIRGNHVTITGGTVTATGGDCGAGIGGGFWGHGSDITITGGTVIANGGYGAAGIGGGNAGDADNITISGGTVTATGGTCGIGAGSVISGSGGNATNLIVTGGNIKSTFQIPLTNAVGGSNVYKTIFTVDSAVADTDVSGNLVIRDLNGKAYGMAGVKTLDTDKVYAYLPLSNALAAYNFVNYATVVSTENDAVFCLAYTINTPDSITLEGVTATVSFGSVFPLRVGGLPVTANVNLSGTANKRGVYTITPQSPTVAISPTSKTRSVVIGDSLADTLSFTFTMTTEDITDLSLSMTFEPTPIHTVTYTSSDATGGSVPAQAEVYQGDNYTVADNGSLTKTGYTFKNWLNGVTVFSGTKAMGTGNVTLAAKWMANNYTVAFNVNGGSGTMASQTYAYDQSKVLSANTFSKPGYTFSGWAKTPGGVKIYNNQESVLNLAESGTITLYALWTANNYTVSFDTGGGSGTMMSQTFTYDKTKAISANTFTKPGYTFSGWAKTAGGTKAYDDNQSVSDIALSGAITLYAKWTANDYTVVFDANKGTGTMSNQVFNDDVTQALSQNTFTKTGYTFCGWAKTATGEMAYNDKKSVSNLAESGTVTLYALWAESRCTVSFNANGGNGTMSNQMFTYDVTQAISQCTFTKPGYSFSGWAKTAGGAKAYDDQQSVSNLAESGTVNLYALWTVNSYTISFQANGGIGTMSSQTFTYDVDQSFSPNAFARPNYTFMGWAANLTGAKVYDNSQSVKNLTQSGTATLFAVWQAKTAVVIDEAQKSFTYDGNPKAFSITGAPNTGFTITYMQNGSIVASPRNAGKYDVKIKRVENATYASYSKTINDGLLINKIQASAFTLMTPKDTFTSFEVITQDLGTLTPSDFTITFGGTPVVATAVSSYASGKYTITIPSQTATSTKVLSVKMNDTLASYSPYTAAVEVTPTVAVTGISFSQTIFRLAKDSSQTLAVVFAPSAATNKAVTWASSDTNIATVSDSGVVTGVKTGTATITATTDDGNKTATCTVSVYVPTPSSGADKTGFDAPVTVDGKTKNIGNKYIDGTKTTVIVDNANLEKQLDSSTGGSSTIIPIAKNKITTARLVVKNVEDMAQKSMTLVIQTEGVSYNIKTDAIDTASLCNHFPGADTSNITFEVTIEQAEYATAIAPADTEIVCTPISFSIIATYEGKSATIDNFSRFLERTIEITEEQAQKITTAVVVGVDGSLRHVPTSIFQNDGKYYATINSLTNSIYALIENEVSFTDAQGKWYEKTVNELASRKIINGIGAGNFAGERSITRAEFATILASALGLPANGTSTFSDVPADAWYSGAVATAAHYGLVGGRGNNRFDPTANITRQEAMAMLQRAAKLTDFTGKSSALSAFSDSGSVDEWALEAAKWNVGSGLIMGNNGQLRPIDNISRAETATVVLRLLQTAELVDVRR